MIDDQTSICNNDLIVQTHTHKAIRLFTQNTSEVVESERLSRTHTHSHT